MSFCGGMQFLEKIIVVEKDLPDPFKGFEAMIPLRKGR